jgi:putative peptide zinc metalloprotease protein
MGLMFLYLAPCFFVDVTESWVSASKVQRLATIIAGIWIEMVICGAAMAFWLNTAAGGWLHNLAYEIILLTGIAVVVINLNPLIKLDGYYFLTESIEIPDLKERSTAFLSGWFQNHILGLSVETPIVPRRRAAFFFLYAFVSGSYSYLMLFFVVRLSYRLTSNWIAEFALIPAGALAFVIYRSRLRALWRVTRQFWNEKFSSGIRWRPVHFIAIAIAAAILFLPLWRDRDDAYFVIEPTHSLTLHAAMPGRVSAVLIRQGQRVHAGDPLIRMNSGMASSMQAEAEAATESASFQANNSQLKGESIASVAAEQNGAAHFRTIANEAQSSLELAAPAEGIVLTQNPTQLLQQNVASGQPLLDLADPRSRTVRLFIPASVLSRIPSSAEVALALPGQFSLVRMPLSQPSGESVTLPDGLIAKQNYQGIKLPVFYSSRMTLPESSGNPMFGLTGEAKIFGARHSLAERLLTGTLNLVKAHVW